MNYNILRHKHNSEHQNPDYPDHPAPGGGNYEERVSRHQKYPQKDELPFQPARGGASTKRPGIRERLREKFREHPATKEEIMQLELDTRREQLKSQKYNYKHQRPSAFERIVGGSQRQPRPSRGGAPRQRLGGSMLDSRPSISFISKNTQPTSQGFGSGLHSLLGSGMQEQPKKYQKKQVPPTWGSGLSKMFSI